MATEFICENPDCQAISTTGQACQKCGSKQFKVRENGLPTNEIIDESKLVRIKIDFYTLAVNQQIFKEINDLIHQLKTLTIFELSCSDFSKEDTIKVETPITVKPKKVWH